VRAGSRRYCTGESRESSQLRVAGRAERTVRFRRRLPHRWKRSHIDARGHRRRPARAERCSRSIDRCSGDPAGSSSGRSCSDRSFRDRAQYESYVPGSYRGRPSTYPRCGSVRSARSRYRAVVRDPPSPSSSSTCSRRYRKSSAFHPHLERARELSRSAERVLCSRIFLYDGYKRPRGRLRMLHAYEQCGPNFPAGPAIVIASSRERTRRYLASLRLPTSRAI